jgi:transcriptional regulator with XRE-family HTH domain
MNGMLDGLNTSGRLRVLMAAKGLTQVDLAAVLDVTRETIVNRFDANRWLIDDLKKISDKYGVDVTELI